jgi:flagellar basal-body rod protein FlgB
MELSGISVFQLASRRLDWLAQRQSVIARNIANADTPDFKARDVEPFSALVDRGRSPGLARTHPAHITGSMTGTAARLANPGWDVSINGNDVVLEEQSLKAAEVAEAFQLATMVYKRGHDLLGLALTSK